MARFAVKLEYDGAPFCGWQRQKGLPSVQGALETALSRIAPAAPTVAAAGRTDTGVHALGQVAHFDLARDWDPYRLGQALNFHLKPDPVAVVDTVAVSDSFHARFSAIERRYLFRLQIRRAPVVHDRGNVWHLTHDLDIEAMRTAAAHLIGKHDFTTFRATQCQAASPVKTLDSLEIETLKIPSGSEIRFHLRARSFLHNQVRSIVGSLERVGAGAWTPDDMKAALKAADRAACGPVSPPQGLYLAAVTYPEDPFA